MDLHFDSAVSISAIVRCRYGGPPKTLWPENMAAFNPAQDRQARSRRETCSIHSLRRGVRNPQVSFARRSSSADWACLMPGARRRADSSSEGNTDTPTEVGGNIFISLYCRNSLLPGHMERPVTRAPPPSNPNPPPNPAAEYHQLPGRKEKRGELSLGRVPLLARGSVATY